MYTTNLEISMSLFNMEALISKIKSRDNPEANFLILSLILETNYGADQDN